MARRDRKLALHLADLHCGCKLGLMPPDVVLQEEDELGNSVPWTPRQSPTQAYLWRCFEEDLDDAKRLAGKMPIVVDVDGDLTHGTKYMEQLVSTRPADQPVIAVACLKRILQLPNITAMRVMTGTAAHEMAEGSLPIMAVRELQARYPKVNIAIRHHGLFDICGVSHDVAHHGPAPGIRNWLRGNVLRLYTLSLMQDNLDVGNEPPRVVIRGHRHTYKRETVRKETPLREYVTDAFLLASYSGLTHHGRQVAQSPAFIGNVLLALICEEGELVRVEAFRHFMDVRTKEKL